MDGTVGLDMLNFQNSCYLADMWLGTPPQHLTVLFDTGSSHTWAISRESAEKMNGRMGSPITSYFDKNASTTCVDPGFDWKMFIQFGIG